MSKQTFDEFLNQYPSATYADYLAAWATPAYVDPWDV